jgi:hypothetical protein
LTVTAGSGITAVALGAKNLVGTIPASFAGLTNLTSLDLNGNVLSGTFMDELAGLTKLLTLKLNGNAFSGTVSAALGSLTALTALNVDVGNNLCGTLPPALSARCATAATCNGLEPPASAANFKKPGLKSCTPVSADGFTCLVTDDQAVCRVMYEFWVGMGCTPAGCPWSGDGGWGGGAYNWLSNAQGNPLYSYCAFSYITCFSTTSYVGDANVKIVKLNMNQVPAAKFTGPVPAVIGNLTSLTYIAMTSNPGLIGSIPASLGQLTALTYLYACTQMLLLFSAPCSARACAHSLILADSPLWHARTQLLWVHRPVWHGPGSCADSLRYCGCYLQWS